MSVYSFALALGAAGLVVMGLSGLAHVAGGHHGAHAHGGSHMGHNLAQARGGFRARGGGRGAGPRTLWALLSPRPLFSMLLGFGTVGVVLASTLGGAPLFATAAAGGLLFEALLVRPLWNLLFRFESTPALTLELDGQVVQVLGSLRREDRDAGIRVRAGDPVSIDDIDAERNRCTVRPLGA